MTLYEIDSAIMDCIDAETGEIIDPAKLEALQMERESKIENVALWVKNLKALTSAIKAEKDALAEREAIHKAKIESLSKWLVGALDGTKFETPKVKISFRNSEAVEIVNESDIPAEYMREKVQTAPDKTAIKEALKNNFQIPGAILVQNKNIQIK